jgi:hypothetical protein
METEERQQGWRRNAKGLCENESSFEMLDNLRSRASSLVDVGASPLALKRAPRCQCSGGYGRDLGPGSFPGEASVGRRECREMARRVRDL